MKGTQVILTAVLFFFLTLSNLNQVFAKSLEEEVRELKTRVAELERKLAEECTKTKRQEEVVSKHQTRIEHIDSHIKEYRIVGVEIAEGLKIGLGGTLVVQGTPEANNTNTKDEGVTDAAYSIDLEIESEVGDNGLAFAHLETGDGAGVEDELQLFSNVNRDADDSDNSVSLTELWYQHALFGGQLNVKFGKIEACAHVDQNAIANDEHVQFLGRIFRNASTIQFPDNGAGLRGILALEETPWFELEGQVLDGDADWEDIGDEIFTSGQVNLKPALIEDRECNYRFYGWYKDTNHVEWKNSSNMKEENYGFGISADQELTDVVTIFGRYGWQNPEVYTSGADFSLEHTWSAGAQIMGSPWGREEDCIGLAIGMEIPSDDYKDTQNRKGDNEGHLEAYYYCQLNEHLSISPDFQLIWDAYGNDVSDREDTIYVFGSRAQVDF